tara:strand:- start:13112 stop:14392 length:1281 start_codon:yes stop_codon:yes gene_type:complete
MISIAVNGIPYENFTEASLDLSLDTLCGEFSFVATMSPSEAPEFPIQVGQQCKIYVDKTLALTGSVEVISGSYNASSYDISIQGRDNTADIVDSTIGGEVGLEALQEIGVVEFTKFVLEATGINKKSETFKYFTGNRLASATPFGVISVPESETVTQTYPPRIPVYTNVPNVQPFGTGDLQDAATSDTVFQYLDKQARMRSLLLTTDRFGRLEYQSASGISDKSTTIINRLGENLNNVLSASFTNDISKLFNSYNVRAQQNMLALNEAGDISTQALADSGGAAVFDKSIRESRVLNIIAESATNADSCEKRAKWQRGINRAKAFQYNINVVGHSKNDGSIWKLNRLHNVEDDFAKVDGQLLLNRITFKMDLNTGNTTNLGFVSKDAYTLEVQDPDKIAFYKVPVQEEIAITDAQRYAAYSSLTGGF